MLLPALPLLLLAAASLPPTSAKRLWYTAPGSTTRWAGDALLIGNGKLGGAFFGGVNDDKVLLNIDSLWTGGPFADPTYNGGNPTSSKVSQLQAIRTAILGASNGLGSAKALMGSTANYGSMSYLGALDVMMPSLGAPTGYQRWLDLSTGLGGSSFTIGSQKFTRSYFCSFPANVCVYSVSVSSGTLPAASINLNSPQRVPGPTFTCTASTGKIGMRGRAEAPTTAMIYDSQAYIVAGSLSGATCGTNGTLNLPGGKNSEFYVVIAGDTNYDSSKGNAASGWTFKGTDPATRVSATVDAAKAQSLAALTAAHVADYQSLTSKFTLSLPDPNGSAGKTTDVLVNTYNLANGDPYLENLMFDFSRHLMISCTRGSSLPSGLQGRWSQGITTSWGADFHANINMNMNLWGADQTGLGYAADNVWKYISDTWVPRGTETAKLLYGARGWVTHDEMNIFGHTSMKSGSTQWANFPASAAWLMQYIWDHYDYTRDATWLKTKGYPLIKGVALFWLDSLVDDTHTKDGTLITVPADSPEHTPLGSGLSTFGASMWQQLIFEVFNNCQKAFTIVGETDSAFTSSVAGKLAKLYPGVAVGSWGQLKEWKIDYDNKTETHRHLSNIYGWYPGYAISSVYRASTAITNAVQTSLTARGVGNGPDANAGWEKVWRAACWAWLNNVSKAYYELKYTIDQNIVGNLFSMYGGKKGSFQIDANFGFGGAVLTMLVKDFDYKSSEWDSVTRVVTLGPAIPSQWGGGSVKGLRLRGSAVVDFSWDTAGLVDKVHVVAAGVGTRKFVDRAGTTITPS